MKRIGYHFACAIVYWAILIVPGCGFWKSMKPVVNTVDDVARSLCAQWYGDKMSMSVDDAVRAYCLTRDAWSPWIDPALASMAMGGQLKLNKVGAPAECVEPEEPAGAAEPPQPAAKPQTPATAPTLAPPVETAPQDPPSTASVDQWPRCTAVRYAAGLCIPWHLSTGE